MKTLSVHLDLSVDIDYEYDPWTKDSVLRLIKQIENDTDLTIDSDMDCPYIVPEESNTFDEGLYLDKNEVKVKNIDVVIYEAEE